MADRFNADPGAGFRGNPADLAASGAGMGSSQRGGWNSEQNPSGTGGQEVLSSQMPGNPHSSSGFRRALKSAARSQSKLKNQLPQGTTFGAKGFKKPNYFAQGGQRHGMHISTGAPHTGAASQEGADAGGS